MDLFRFFTHTKIIILIILLLLTGVQAVYASAPRHILLLNSYHQNMTWVKDIVRSVEDELKSDQSDLVLHVENMDSKRFHSDPYIKSLYHFYQAKYRQTKFDLILLSDNNAYDFLREYRDELFPGVPVVFCGVNFFQEEQLAGLRDFTGVEEVFDAAATLEIVLRNHPDTREVFIVNDYLKTGRAWEQAIRQQLEPFSSKLNLRYAENLSLAELEGQLSKLGPGSIVLFGVYFSDRDGHYVTYERIGEVLSQSSKVPVYCLLEFNVGEGVIGGSVISGTSQGQRMTAMGKRILQGMSAAQVPVVRTGTTQNIFDFGQLKRFGIHEDKLPTDHLIINQPFSFYREYRELILLTFGFIGLLLLAILILLRNIRQRQLAENLLLESTQKFETLFDQSFEFIGLMTPDGILLDANRTSVKFTGQKKEDLLNQPLWETAWWQHSTGAQRQLRKEIKLAASGEIAHFETTHCSATGSIHNIDFSITPLFNESGQVTLLVPEGRDISEHKKNEALISRQRAEFSAIFDSISDAIVFVDPQRQIIRVNPAFTRILGYQPEEVIGHTTQIIYADPESYIAQGQKRFNFQASSEDMFFENEYRRKDGSSFVGEALGVKVLDRNGKKIGFMATIRDITERKLIEQDKKGFEAHLQQIHKMEAIGTMAGGIAHDFNNVLAIIRGNIDIIQRKQKNGIPFEKNLEHINKSTSRATDLVKQILAFSRQEKPELSPVNLVFALNESLRLMRSTIPATVEIMNTVDKEKIHINADDTQLQQILINLCTNAVHAMEARGLLTVNLQEVTLSQDEIPVVTNQQGGRYARLTVADTGTGMNEETIARIFEPFFTTKPVGSGTGMGLSVVYGIVNSHGGFITVDSVPGQGTSFNLYFPIVSIEEVEPEMPAEKSLPVGTEHILFVDDEKHISDICSEMLVSLGYEVTSLTKSKEALVAFKGDPQKFDLVLTDQTMPEMTGTELSSELLKARPNIPIILCSGFSATTSERHAKMIGIRKYAMKPISMSQLAKIVRKVLDEDGLLVSGG